MTADIDQELVEAVQAKARARKILKSYMEKPGATLESDIFGPTVVAICAAVVDAEPLIAKREREKVLRELRFPSEWMVETYRKQRKRITHADLGMGDLQAAAFTLAAKDRIDLT